jgi:hypothetical protein
LSKFEKYFEAIKKNNKDCNFFLRRDNFRNPKRKLGTNEHVGPISIFNFEKEKQRDNLQQHQQTPSQQQELTHEHTS